MRGGLSAGLLLSLVMALGLTGCQVGQRQPRARYGAALLWDAAGDQMVLFGGRAQGLLGEIVLNDTWLFNLGDLTWKELNTGAAPPARLSPGAVIDPVSRQVILFGGLGRDRRFGDTWVLDLEDASWEEISPPISPSARSDMGMALDPDRQTALLFGGYCQEFQREICADTWEFDLRSKTWSERETAGSPPITYGQRLVFDPHTQRFLQWGGHMTGIAGGVYRSLGYSDSLWSWSGAASEWSVVAPDGGSRPPARYWHQMAFDPISAQIILYGGDGGQGYLEDTWVYDSLSNRWRLVPVEDPPSARINGAAAYDPGRQQWILFGGLGEDFKIFRDTWIYSADGTWERVYP